MIRTARTREFMCMRVCIKDWDSIWDDMDALREQKINDTDVDNDEANPARMWVSVPNSNVELPEGVSMDQL